MWVCPQSPPWTREDLEILTRVLRLVVLEPSPGKTIDLTRDLLLRLDNLKKMNP
jgi:hypothetical protein